MIDAHRGAFEYDWRTRFHLPLSDVGKSMSWGEAFRLTRTLTSDPTSHIAAAISGWDLPASRETLTLMDLYDLTHLIAWGSGGGKGSKPKPYPRPWPEQTKRRTGPDRQVSRAEIEAALRFAGHTAPMPA